MRGSHYVVTGGLGYIGRVLTDELVSRGARVVVVDNELVGPAPPDNPDVQHVIADIRRPWDYQHVFSGAEGVVHLAAIVGDPACNIDRGLTQETNYEGTVAVAHACKRAGVRRLVFASTCSGYGVSRGKLSDVSDALLPQSLYAETKILAERFLLEARDDRFFPCILRLATVHGISPRMRFDLVVNGMTARAVHEGRIHVCGGQQWRPFLHVRDGARAMVTALQSGPGPGPEILNCGSDVENYRLVEVGRTVAEEVPEAALEVSPDMVDPRDYRVSFGDASTRLGFNPPVRLREGVREVRQALLDGHYSDFTHERYRNDLLTRRFVDRLDPTGHSLADA